MPRTSVVVLLVCAFVAAAAPSNAQYFGRNKVHYDTLRFRVLKTEHFDIHYYDDEELATRQAARMAERWYVRFSRLFDHTFTHRQSLVLYASHPHFAQTNVSASVPGEGVGGLTERNKSRIAMPFAAGLGETDHVLGHEIAHTFQIDIARRVKRDAFTLPGWCIEGMAEYLSLGAVNTNTSMWLRDAALNKRLPSLEQLNDPRYFPYRYGHALWAYLAATYGDDVIGRVLRSRTSGVIPRLEEITGRTRDDLTREWHESITATYGADPGTTTAGRLLLTDSRQGRVQVGPALSPDGTKLMFLSERDRVSLGLFLADTVTGDVTRKVVSTGSDPHFDSLQYIQSAGAWDATGRRFVFSALHEGQPVLTIVETAAPGAREEFTIGELGEIYSPSWSPDGTSVVFSALKGGLSDLFIYTPATRALRQLTADPFADLQPVWSPDGRTIAFASDRFTTSVERLAFGPMRLVLLDVAAGTMRGLTPDPSSAKQINPQWAPDGGHVYYVSDREGVSNVFRVELASGEVRQVTDVAGGVSGITATSPSLAVAAKTGTIAFSVYTKGRYEIRAIEAAEARQARVVPAPDAAPTEESILADPVSGALARLLADARLGLPDPARFTASAYDDRLRLESMAQPYVGATTTSSFGGVLQAGFGFVFGDTLRDRQLQTLFRVGTDVDDFATQIAYVNRRSQWNWGLNGGLVPSRFGGARRSIARDGDMLTREVANLRYMHEWMQLTSQYNLSRSRRVELGFGMRRTGVTWQTVTRVQDTRRSDVLSQTESESAAGPALYLGDAHVAFVHDTAMFGATSPVVGQRYRLEIDPAFGAVNFVDVTADARRYFMPVRPITIAARLEHRGRYGSADPRLTPLVFGLQSFVRGYNLTSFAAEACGRGATECSIVDQIRGGRLALMNLEVRAPLLGLLSGQQDSAVPIEALAFVDAGFLWTRPGGIDRSARTRFRSVGAGGRVNMGGIVLEVTAARPIDRRNAVTGLKEGWMTSFLIRPGF